jgi:hypothetical protein
VNDLFGFTERPGMAQAVEPLQVIDQRQHGALGRSLAQELQEGVAQRVMIRGGRGFETEDDAQRVPVLAVKQRGRPRQWPESEVQPGRS